MELLILIFGFYSLYLVVQAITSQIDYYNFKKNKRYNEKTRKFKNRSM